MFLRNHADAIAAIDRCVGSDANIRVSVCFFVVGHGRRQVVEDFRGARADYLARDNETHTHSRLASDAPVDMRLHKHGITFAVRRIKSA